jgi:hypothetical protein
MWKSTSHSAECLYSTRVRAPDSTSMHEDTGRSINAGERCHTAWRPAEDATGGTNMSPNMGRFEVVRGAGIELAMLIDRESILDFLLAMIFQTC